MKNMMKYFCLAVLAFAATAMTSCEKDEPAYNGDGVHFSTTVKLAGSTKALDADGHKTFAEGDQIAVIYKNTSGATVKAVSDALATSDIESGGKVAKFSVDLDNPDKTKNVTYIYPAAMANSDGTMASIATQDGTLESLSSSLDYCTFTGAWSAGNLPANVSLTNELAILKLNITDGSSDITANVRQLTVSNGSNTVEVNRTPAAGPIYVAMLPVATGDIAFVAEDNSGDYYAKTVSGKTLNAGSLYPITIAMPFSSFYTPLTLEALTAGTIAVSSPKSGMKYSKNGGAKTAVAGSITVAIGDKVRFYGNGNSITSYSGTKIAGGTAQVKAYGNMISLVKETDYTSATTLATEAFKEFFKGNTTLINASGLLLPANVTLGTSSCQSMFSGCNKMTTAPAELPAALATSCYRSLFYQCTSLTTVPALPVTTMCESCYYQLFRGCTALTTVPADLLPATTMERYCYYGMFYGCTNLTTVPALPATQINDKCYNYMFYKCSSITTAPVLPAQTVPDGTYQEMFRYCSSLNSVTCYLTEVDVNFTAASWLDGVAATGTFTTPSGTNWSTGVNGIPSGWNRVDL